MTRFDRDTALSPVGPQRFGGRLDRAWWISRGPNGGYVAALLLRAAQLAVADPERHPRSLTTHFTAPPAEGAVELETRVERTGRSLSTVSVRMMQEGRLVALSLAALSRSRASTVLDSTRMPEVPPPERCWPLSPGLGDSPIRAQYDSRSVFNPARQAPEAIAGGWIRLAEARLPDALLVAAFTDAWPPSIFRHAPEQRTPRGAPTVDLTIHFRCALPPPEASPEDYCLALFRTRLLREGFMEEDGEIWSRSGVLLAQSRQLAVAL